MDIQTRTDFTRALMTRDRKSVARNREVKKLVFDEDSFDQLFMLLFHHQASLVTRSAEAVDKISKQNPGYLIPHKQQIFAMLKSGDYHALKSLLAKLSVRIIWDAEELDEVWRILVYWTMNPNENKNIRVNALQALFDLAQKDDALQVSFEDLAETLKFQHAPSLEARLKKLKILA